MNIRNATYHDAPAIKSLLEQIGYKTSVSLLVNQLETLFNKEGHEIFVYEFRKEVVAFVSMHYLPQLAVDGGLMVISSFSVDEAVKNMSIDSELEKYITNQARLRKCEWIQVQCMDWRTPTHQFYEQQGYQEFPKYFAKRLVYGE